MKKFILLYFFLIKIFFCSTIYPLSVLILTDKFPHAPRAYTTHQVIGLLEKSHTVFILAEKKGKPCILSTEHNLQEYVFYKDLPENLRSFDIIYAQFAHQGIKAIEMMDRGYISGKLVVSFRGADATKELYENVDEYQTLFQRASLCLANCEHFRNILIDYGCNQNKVKVLYSGVDINHFVPSNERIFLGKEKKLHLLSVARLIPLKGIEYVVKACADLKQKFPNFMYEVIGDGKTKGYLQHLIKKLGLQNNVKLLGYKTQDEILEKLKMTDLFLHTPVTKADKQKDAIPNSIKEALLAEVPVIVTDHGGIRELIEHRKVGEVVPEKDSVAIYKAILLFLKNPERYVLMARCGARLVRERFSKEVTNQQLVSFLEKIL